MKKTVTGKTILLGSNIDTDQIYPGRYLAITEPQEIGKLCLSGVDETIAQIFPNGGIVVAGTNFGCGSSREHAPIALINMGAAAVVAESFARIFYRNSINLGLPLIVCKGISQIIKEGNTLEVEIDTGLLRIVETGECFQGEALGDQAMSILEAGGIKELMRQRLKK